MRFFAGRIEKETFTTCGSHILGGPGNFEELVKSLVFTLAFPRYEV
jgi:hypothetical protein